MAHSPVCEALAIYQVGRRYRTLGQVLPLHSRSVAVNPRHFQEVRKNQAGAPIEYGMSLTRHYQTLDR